MNIENTRPLKGYQEDEETKKEVPVNPQKFQEELMRVNESDELQKRNKKKKTAEDDDEADKATKEQTTPGGAFASFMSESDENSVLAMQSPENSKTTITTSSGTTFSLEEEEGENTSQSYGAEPEAPSSADYAAAGGELPPEEGFNQNFTEGFDNTFQGDGYYQQDQTQNVQSSQNSQQNQQQSSNSNTDSTDQVSNTKKAKKVPEPKVIKKKTHDTSLQQGKPPPSRMTLKKKKDKTPTINLQTAEPKKVENIGKTGPSDEDKLKVTKSKKTAQPSATTKELESPKKKISKANQNAAEFNKNKKAAELNTEQMTPAQTPKKLQLHQSKKQLSKSQGDLKTDGQLISSSLDPQGAQSDSEGQGHKDKEHDDKTSHLVSGPASGMKPIQDIDQAQATTQAHPLSKLSPAAYALFEKMVGSMTIMQLDNGVKTITVEIDLKGTSFHGSELILEHYDTAPHSFNVTFAGSPEAMETFNDSMADLVAAMKGSELSFEVNIKKPIISEKHRHAVKPSQRVARKKKKSA